MLHTTHRLALGALAALLFSSLGCLVIDNEHSHDEEHHEETVIVNTDDPDQDTTVTDRAPPRTEFLGIMTVDEGLEFPEEAQVLTVWTLPGLSPPQFHVWGRGESKGRLYTMRYPDGAPPEGARNDGWISAGFLVAIPADAEAPADGLLTREQSDALFAQAIGITRDHGVVWRAGDRADTGWADAFPPERIECAQRGEETTAGRHTLTPTGCPSVNLRITDRIGWIHWY